MRPFVAVVVSICSRSTMLDVVLGSIGVGIDPIVACL